MLASASRVQHFEPRDPAARELITAGCTHVVPDGVNVLRVLPDAAIDLVFAGNHLRVAGPDTAAVLESIPTGTRVIGFQLRPGAAESVLGIPASTVRDNRVDLSEVWREAGADVLDAMCEAPDLGTAVAALETAVARRWQRGPAPDDLAGEPIARARERQLGRRCTAAFGYGPKVLARIVRLQTALSQLEQAPVPALAQVAAACGHADQAHLTREMRTLTGLTPASMRSQMTFAFELDDTAAA